jgi:RNA polymerase sigma factor (sigma-70 family)
MPPNDTQPAAGIAQFLYRKSSSTLSDEELLRQAIENGSQSPAWDVLVARLGPCVWNVCRAHTNSEHDADDATQVTFFLLFKTVSDPKHSQIRNIRSWLFRIAQRVASRTQKKRARQPVRSTSDAEASAIASRQVDHLSSQEIQNLVLRELSKLPEKFQAAIVEMKLHELTSNEAAIRLGTNDTTVRKRLTRGLKVLESRLKRYGISGGVLGSVMAGFLTTPAFGANAARWLAGVRADSIAETGLNISLASIQSELSGFWKKSLLYGGIFAVTASASVVAVPFCLPKPAQVTQQTSPRLQLDVEFRDQAKINVNKFELRLWRTVAGEQRTQYLGEIKSHVGVIPAELDRLVCEVSLNQPAPCLLLQILPDGTTRCCSPADPETVPTITKEFRYPSIERHGEISLTEIGNQAFVLVVLKKPESYKTWSARFGSSFPWERLNGDGLWFGLPPADVTEIRPIGLKSEAHNEATATPVNNLGQFIYKQENVDSVRVFGLNPRRNHPRKIGTIPDTEP